MEVTTRRRARSSDSSQLSDYRYRSVYRSLYTGVSNQRSGNWNGKDKEEDIRRKEHWPRVGGQGGRRMEHKSGKAEVGARVRKDGK